MRCVVVFNRDQGLYRGESWSGSVMVAYNGCKRLDVKVTFVALYPGTFIVGRENHFLVNQVKKREGVPRYRAVHAAELGCLIMFSFSTTGGPVFPGFPVSRHDGGQ